MPQDLIVGLDIGTTKICAVVGEVRDRQVEIVGLGTAPTAGGLRKGVVVNIENTVRSIRKAVEEAETMAGCEIRSVFAGVGGGQTKGFNSHGIIAVKDREVSQADVERVIDAARTIAIPSDREVIHTLVQDFMIDGQDGIKDPIGIHGVRLECKVHIVTGAVTSAQNIVRSCHRSGLDVAKAIALGADLVQIGTADLVALECLRCHNCESGRGCARGIATTDPELVDLMTIQYGAARICNMYYSWSWQLKEILRLLGLRSIRELVGRTDLLMHLDYFERAIDDDIRGK